MTGQRTPSTIDTDVATFLLGAHDRDAIALAFEKGVCTYGDLERAVGHFAVHLGNLGLAKGDRVLLIGENSLFWVVSYLGILKAGLVCVPLSPAMARAELEHIVAITEARLALVEARSFTRHRQPLHRLQIITDRRVNPNETTLSYDDLSQASPSVPHSFPAVAAADLAALMFTSGSTGMPRGVMVSHRNIIANTSSIIESLQLTKADRVMTVLPFHYCFGTSLLHTHLRVGGCLVVDSRFMYPEVVLERMAREKCTGFAGVPSHFQILLRSSSLRQRQFPHLRYVQQAGGHLPPALVDELRAALPGTHVIVMYGQTEATARLSYLPAEFIDTKRGSIGKGIPGVRLRVVRTTGEDVQPGEMGEIVAEGDNIASGYWRAPDESLTSFRDGQLYTGDLATVDDDGFIYIVGRGKDFLKCRGERVSCQKLETLLLEHEDLLDAAVVGTPDETLGEAVKAFIVAGASSQKGIEDRVRTFCKQHLPPHLVPKQIVVLRELPKNEAGKVLKRELARLETPISGD